MGRLYVYRGRRREAVYELGADACLIGRNLDAEVHLDDDLASRRHAMIMPSADGLELTDLGSDNGVMVDGERIRSVILEDGLRFAIGRHVLFYRETAAGPTTQASMRAIGADDFEPSGSSRSGEKTTTRIPQIKLEQIQERVAQRLEPHIAFPRSLGREPHMLEADRYVIGYNDECDIRLPGTTLFVKRAAELLEDRNRMWVVVALHRRAGLKVRGEATKMAALNDGDIFTVGRVQMTFCGRVG